MKSEVYFTKEITEENLVKIFEKLEKDLPGKVAVKVHSGEQGNQNYLKPEFLKQIIEKVNGTVVETNTAYEGERNTSEKHKKLLENHNWTKYYNVDLLDEEDCDIKLDIPNGEIIKENYIGKNTENYDSMLVISHFKGHPMGGFGGSLKQLSIGCASSRGKAHIHSGGKTKDQNILWKNTAPQEDFIKAMAESASSVVNYFNGNMAFINVMCNMSVDCDCCKKAEDPCMKDIGILASLDPVALDNACIDLVKNSSDEGKDHLLERINSRKGTIIIERAAELKIGTKEYKLINID